MIGSHISCFAGVGMTDIACEEAGFETTATAEIDPWNRDILRQRFPNAIHFQDVKDVSRVATSLRFPQRPLLVTGGFPCQDVGPSGTGLGLAGDRSGLVRELLRIVHEFRPDYFMAENSSLLTQRGLAFILSRLVAMRYHVRWECLPAASVDAPHLRDRCYIMARRTPFTVPSSAVEIGDFCAAPELIPSKLPRAGMTHYQALYTTTPLVTRRTARLNAEVIHGTLLPTPTKSDGTGGPGTTPKRTGGKNLRTVLAERNKGNGRIDPTFVEWMMGLPMGWTDPDVDLPSQGFAAPMSWRDSRVGLLQEVLPDRNTPHRSKRIQALGNGLVPAVASLALNLFIYS